MSNLLIYAPKASRRLSYVLDWLFNEQLKTGYSLTYNIDNTVNAPFIISYGAALPNAFHIPDAGLLWETGVQQHKISQGLWDGLPVFYANTVEGASIPFDIFSAIFFLLSRYEEYYSYTADKHGRYPATESILLHKGILERPLADEWVHKLRQLFITQHNLHLTTPVFHLQPSYDIDIAWSYKNKGRIRTLGAMGKSVLAGQFAAVADRLEVFMGRHQDPYDSFEWMGQLHKQYNLQPIYFILASEQTTAFDKNISPHRPEMQKLVKSLAKKCRLGIHPSYYTDKQPEKLAREKQVLEAISKKAIYLSRQHYIKLKLPDTYRMLMAVGITDDYSMGYGTHIGFRAGTGQSFLWYNLTTEQVQPLRIHPFCFMDTTAHFDNDMNVETAFNKLYQLASALRAVQGTMITVFHNFSLGTDKEWTGWKQAYAKFIASMQQ